MSSSRRAGQVGYHVLKISSLGDLLVLLVFLNRPALILKDRELRFALHPSLPPLVGELLPLLPNGSSVLTFAQAASGWLFALRLDFRCCRAAIL